MTKNYFEKIMRFMYKDMKTDYLPISDYIRPHEKILPPEKKISYKSCRGKNLGDCC